MSIKALFNSITKWNNDRNQVSDLAHAIKAKDADEVKRLIKSNDRGPYLKSFDKLIKTAMNTDDARVFDAVFQLHPDPNHRFRSISFNRFCSIEQETSLLHQAILDDRKNVALYLAKEPGLKVNQSGGFFKTNGMFGTDAVLPTPLAFARKQGMDEVAAVLAQRTAGRNFRPEP